MAALPDLDPSKDPARAEAWIKQILGDLQASQAALDGWYRALVEQIAIGIVRCDDVLKYNREALKLYYAAVKFYAWIGPAITTLKSRGYNIVPGDELPFPYLIGTGFRVTGSKGARSFDYGLVCMPNGRDFSPATPKSALQIQSTPSCPTERQLSGVAGEMARTKAGTIVYNPYASIESLNLTDGGLGFIGACVAGGPLAMIFCATIAIVGFLALSKVVGWISGNDRAEIEAGVLRDEREQDEKRAIFITECAKARMGIRPGADLSKLPQWTPDQIAKWQEECAALAEKAIPKRGLSAGTIAGLTTLALVVGGAALAVAIVRSRRGSAQAD